MRRVDFGGPFEVPPAAREDLPSSATTAMIRRCDYVEGIPGRPSKVTMTFVAGKEQRLAFVVHADSKTYAITVGFVADKKGRPGLQTIEIPLPQLPVGTCVIVKNKGTDPVLREFV